MEDVDSAHLVVDFAEDSAAAVEDSAAAVEDSAAAVEDSAAVVEDMVAVVILQVNIVIRIQVCTKVIVKVLNLTTVQDFGTLTREKTNVIR